MYAERSYDSLRYYSFAIKKDGDNFIIKTDLVIREIVSDIEKGISREDIARKFHNGITKITLTICSILRQRNHLNTVAISEGVFQNKLLLETLTKGLRQRKFKVYYNQLLPTNDGAISLGQVAIVKCA